MDAFMYFVDHMPSIITAIFTGLIAWRQADNSRKMTETNSTTKAIRQDLNNGVGEKIAASAVEHMKPAIHEAAASAASGLKEVATVEAEKIERRADQVASALALKAAESWNGVERRTGVADRRTGPPDRRGGNPANAEK